VFVRKARHFDDIHTSNGPVANKDLIDHTKVMRETLDMLDEANQALFEKAASWRGYHKQRRQRWKGCRRRLLRNVRILRMKMIKFWVKKRWLEETLAMIIYYP